MTGEAGEDISGTTIFRTACNRLFSSRLRINMVSGLATNAVNTVVLAAGYPLYLYFLGYEQYGVWLVLATVLTFAQLGNLGIGPAVMKLVAEEHGRQNTLGIQQYVTTALVLLCISGTLVLVTILAFRRQIIGLFRLTDANAQMALWLLPYIGVLSIYVFVVQVMEAMLSGLGRMDLANYRGVLARVINLSVSGLLLFLGFGVNSLLIGRIAAEVVTHLAIVLSIRRLFGIRLLGRDSLDLARGKRLLNFGGMVFGGSLLSMLFSPLNKLVLSRYVGVAAVPIYEIALMGSMKIQGLVTAGQGALVPEISRISTEWSAKTRSRVSELHTRSLKLLVLLGVPIFVVLATLAPLVLEFWLGARFVEELPTAFRIMLLGTFMGVLGTPAYHVLMGMGHVRQTFASRIALVVVNAVAILGILAASQVTVAAIAWASSAAMGTMTLYLVVQKRRILTQPITSEPAQMRSCLYAGWLSDIAQQSKRDA